MARATLNLKLMCVIGGMCVCQCVCVCVCVCGGLI